MSFNTTGLLANLRLLHGFLMNHHGGNVFHATSYSILLLCAVVRIAIHSVDTAGVAKMNRRIKPIHITLAPGLLDEIDARLSHKMSRSNWIRGACEMKLDKDVTEVNDLTDKQLVNILRNRHNYDGPAEAILKSLLEVLSE